MNDNISMPENGGGRIVRNITISKLSLHIFALAASLILFVLFIAAWKNFWDMSYKPGVLFKQTYLYIILSFPVHELIHALGFRFFGKIPWSKIKFGFAVKLLAPYASPTIPIKKSAYVWAGALPGLTIGVLPVVLGFIIGSMSLSFVGLISVISATGDVFIIWTLLGVASNQFVLEHADQCNFSIMEYI